MGQSVGKMSGKALRTLGNMVKTHMELDGNIMRTKKFQKISKRPPPSPKRKKTRLLGCMLSHSIGCQKHLCLPMFFYHFWPRLMARVELRGLWLAQILSNCEITYIITSPNLTMPFPYHHNIPTKCM
jgi:hypothetical protein